VSKQNQGIISRALGIENHVTTNRKHLPHQLSVFAISAQPKAATS